MGPIHVQIKIKDLKSGLGSGFVVETLIRLNQVIKKVSANYPTQEKSYHSLKYLHQLGPKSAKF
jgi:hypothetical protein